MVNNTINTHLLLSQPIRRYLTRDMSINEKYSYLNYINGDENSTEWLEKGLERREHLLHLQLTCDLCNSYISIRENGLSKCLNGHYCTEKVIDHLPY